MIADVTFERTVFQPPPARFEAGTCNIADAVGLGAALDYLQKLGPENVAKYEHDLLDYATHQLRQTSKVRLVGAALQKTSVLSFVIPGHKTEDIGRSLNDEGIAVRSSHHCAKPILRALAWKPACVPRLPSTTPAKRLTISRRWCGESRVVERKRTCCVSAS